MGSTITSQLKPTSPLTPEQYDACKWKVMLREQSHKVHTINSGYRLFESDGMKMMELNSDYVNSCWDGSLINVYCSGNESNYIKLELEGELNAVLVYK
ncbi:hypothetical protein DPMN_175102 [Dreissena polymorpha]|uniref:Uncharacterized protein n=1 Tax=Dreissena polymorpha TaxID=45954 RepID=A0A9D4IHS5_DREPO|nr:hypothetical protein DPMN_175102 [Dreissena polymorpha]